MTPTSAPARRAVAGVAAASVAALLSACSSSAPAAPTVTVTTHPASAPAASGSGSPTPGAGAASPSPSGSPSAGSGPAPCPTRYLSVTIGQTQGTAGSFYYVLLFRNIAHGVTCTLYGFPGVALAGGHPVTQIGTAAAENPATPRMLVTLAPGAVAHAVLRIVDAGVYPQSACMPTPADYLQIYPPNQTTPVYVGIHATACSRPITLPTVNAVAPGSGGSG